MLHTIALINESTVVEDGEITEIARALQLQVNRDFRPVWGTNATVTPLAKGQTPPPGSWWLVVADDLDVAGALGYHDLTPDLQPVGKVGAKLDLEYGASVSVTVSHEGLEMLGDPRINLLVEDPDARRIYAFENCDAVEADELGYEVAGKLMSDFVLPEFFDPNFHGTGKPLSFRGNVSEPFSLAPGGYLSYREVGDSEWRQVTAEEGALAETPEDLSGPEHTEARQPGRRAAGFPKGSRRERRLRRAHNELKVSAVVPLDRRQ